MKETIKVTRDHLFGINKVLEGMVGVYNNRFKYFLKRNKDLLKGEVEAINEGMKTNVKGFSEYENKRIEKLKVCLEMDEEGKPVIDPLKPNSFKLKQDKIEEFNAYMMLIAEEHREDISNREKEIIDFNKLISEEIEIEVYKIYNDLIPDDLDQKDYEIIFSLIKDNE